MTSFVLYLLIFVAQPEAMMILKGGTYDDYNSCAEEGIAWQLNSQIPIKEWGFHCQPVAEKGVQKNPALGGAMEVTKE